jgi:hypothetical protein
METIKDKLKSKWVLSIVIIVVFFLITDTLYLLKLVDINNRLGGESLAYSIGYLFGFFISPILDLTILYALLFKIEIADNK